MITLYLLQHSYSAGCEEDTKIIGIYSSVEKAEAVIQRYKQLPGFMDYPGDFYIDPYCVDEDQWIEGFV